MGTVILPEWSFYPNSTLKSEFHCILAGVVLRWDGGNFPPPKSQPCPPNILVTLFDKLKASAYRCKTERSVTFKMRFRLGLCPRPHWGISWC